MQEKVADMIAGWYTDSYSNLMVGEKIAEAMGSSGTNSASVACQSAMDICVNQLCPALSSVGTAIALTFFIMALVEMVTSERLTMEMFIKFFSKLVISVVLIGYCSTLVQTCIQFGDALSAGILKAIGGDIAAIDTSEVYKNYYDLVNADGANWIMMLINAVVSLGIIKIVSLIFTVVTYLVSFSRLLEMGVRGAFMPVALGLMSDDGWRGAGGRYIRKFLAVCAQGGALVTIGILSQKIMESCSKSMLNMTDETSAMSSLLILIGVAFATVSLMFKSIGIINDAFGG